MAPGPGNAWHYPGFAEPGANYAAMRNPLFPFDPKNPITTVTIFSGNQFAGGDRAGNQQVIGSAVKYKLATETTWHSAAMAFDQQAGNNKYFSADIPVAGIPMLTQIQYYFALAYGDRDQTYIGVAQDDFTGWYSGALPSEAIAQGRPFTFTLGNKNQQKPFNYSAKSPKEQGEWSEPFPLPNVAAHAHLLHTGKILIWGRRDSPKQSMNTFPATALKDRAGEPIADPATCTPYLLDLPDKTSIKKWINTKQPFMPDGVRLNEKWPLTKDPSGKNNANLFCSGHTFLPGGKLFVAGGHLTDSVGADQSCIYEPDSKEGTWKAVPARNGAVMGKGRWYPTAITLPTGVPFVASGSFAREQNNDTQILDNDKFSGVDPNGKIFDLYPRMHVASTGIVYWISSPIAIYSLDMLASDHTWKRIEATGRSLRDYGCSVMYGKDTVIYIGGGQSPTEATDTLVLSDRNNVKWESASAMNFPRRQHNATVLPDGSVLVTGGTRGNGEGATEFPDDVRHNDLRPGKPVHVAELWDSKLDRKNEKWKIMASEQIDRCYHSTALLLPDGRVLSAGGGEFQLGKNANDDLDSHLDAQIFSPPYLFQEGTRPKIESTSTDVIVCGVGSIFTIVTAEPGQIDKINFIGMSSVTHSNNTGQRLVPLDFDKNSKPLKVNAPLNVSSCPPGYYMLFIVNKKGVPSEAKIIQVKPTPEASIKHRELTAQIVAKDIKPPTVLEIRQAVREADNGTRIELGITPTCPYGLSACWGGAFEALSNLADVKRVDPIPHASGSTASVFLEDNRLPDLDLWTGQFKGYVGETYGLRGFEAEINGMIEARDGGIVMASDGVRPEVSLERLSPDGKVQWDKDTRRPQTVTDEESGAYDGLVRSASSGSVGPVTVTGPLIQEGAAYQLQVRLVK